MQTVQSFDPQRKLIALCWLNMLIAIGMSTSVFTGQLKITLDVGFMTLIFPASNLFFAFLTFPITDVIADIFGKKEARTAVYVGFVSQFLTIAIVQLALLFPGDTSKLIPFALGGWKILLASALAYFAAQFCDIYIFHWIKENWTGEKHLWLRNNLSTFTSQFINSLLFIGIVFGFEALMVMMVSSMIVKWMIALLDTPFVYAVRYIILQNLEKKENLDEKHSLA